MKHKEFIDQIKRLDDLERPIQDDDTLAALWGFFKYKKEQLLKYCITTWKLDNPKYPTGGQLMGLALKQEYNERMALSPKDRVSGCPRCDDGLILGLNGELLRCSCPRGKQRNPIHGRFYDNVYPDEPYRTWDESLGAAMGNGADRT